MSIPGILVDNIFTGSQQCALEAKKAKGTLWFLKKSTDIKLRKVLPSTLSW